MEGCSATAHNMGVQKIVLSNINKMESSDETRMKVRQDQLHRGWYPNIENFGSIMVPFASQNCLMILDNQRNINLIHSVVATAIVRSLVPYAAGDIIVWRPEHFDGWNISLKTSREKWASWEHYIECPLSKHFADSNFYLSPVLQNTTFCSHLNLSRYLVHSECIRCMVDIFFVSTTTGCLANYILLLCFLHRSKLGIPPSIHCSRDNSIYQNYDS